MNIKVKKTILVLLTVCLTLSITTAAVSATKDYSNVKNAENSKGYCTNPNCYVVPVDSKYLGKTYGEWSAKWWQWALAIPKPKNPILDKTGKNGDIGQSGSVWFLAGTNGVTGVKRTVEIPAGKAIFIPIINVVSFPYPDPETDDQLKSDVKYVFDQETVHKIELDGKNLDNFRVPSNIFMFWIPKNSYLNLGYPDMPSGSYRAASDGYWVMLKPLPEGIHAIRIYGKGILTETGVTYNIIVKPKRC